MNRLFVFIIISALSSSCTGQNELNDQVQIKVGAARTEVYLPLLRNKNVGLLVNQTATIEETHLLDSLLASGITVTKVFAPEHGFRGDHDNGAHVQSGKDLKSGLLILSLYGLSKKTNDENLKDLDVVIFDIQDVGARFYTYISTMHYMMEACAKNDIQMIIFDRPNPNGHYVDGPVRTPEAKSFVGMHPIPIVHGMTVGELALMIKGEGWLDTDKPLDLKVIEMQNWDHNTLYSLPISPSPNLPNDQAIALYPSLCLFEQTNISIGRGTDFPFQVIGYPDSTFGNFEFTPISLPGKSTKPKHQNQKCYGRDLRKVNRPNQLDLSYLIEAYQSSNDRENFFSKYFYRLAGTKALEKQIIEGKTANEIRDSWITELESFKMIRKKYLLYE